MGEQFLATKVCSLKLDGNMFRLNWTKVQTKLQENLKWIYLC